MSRVSTMLAIAHHYLACPPVPPIAWRYDHLPPHLGAITFRVVSAWEGIRLGDAAQAERELEQLIDVFTQMRDGVPHPGELDAGLHKLRLLPSAPSPVVAERLLLEAKDCFVRAHVQGDAAPAVPPEPVAAPRGWWGAAGLALAALALRCSPMAGTPIEVADVGPSNHADAPADEEPPDVTPGAASACPADALLPEAVKWCDRVANCVGGEGGDACAVTEVSSWARTCGWPAAGDQCALALQALYQCWYDTLACGDDGSVLVAPCTPERAAAAAGCE